MNSRNDLPFLTPATATDSSLRPPLNKINVRHSSTHASFCLFEEENNSANSKRLTTMLPTSIAPFARRSHTMQTHLLSLKVAEARDLTLWRHLPTIMRETFRNVIDQQNSLLGKSFLGIKIGSPNLWLLVSGLLTYTRNRSCCSNATMIP